MASVGNWVQPAPVTFAVSLEVSLLETTAWRTSHQITGFCLSFPLPKRGGSTPPPSVEGSQVLLAAAHLSDGMDSSAASFLIHLKLHDCVHCP